MTTQSIARGSPASIVECWYGEYRFVPAPFVEWSVESEHDPDDKTRTVETTRIKLDGTFVILPDGSYERMFTMQETLRTAFSVDGYEFRLVAGAGNTTLASGTVIKDGIFPQVKSVIVEPDIQQHRLDYSVDLIASTASTSGAAVTELTDTWDLSENEAGGYIDVSHNVSAKGINTLSSGTNAIHNAKDAVLPRLGASNLPYYLPGYTEPTASGGGTTNIYEIGLKRTERADTLEGIYSVSEAFAIVSGVNAYIHNQTASFAEDENQIATITINGNITGAGRTNHNASGGIAFDRAYAAFRNTIKPNFATEASGIYAYYKADPQDHYLYTTNWLSLSVSENRYAGTINYTVSYSDDPSENLPSGILEASTSLDRVDGIRLYGSHPIPFRRLGNVVQDIKTTTEGQITVNASARSKNTGNTTTDTNRAINHVQTEINRLRPNSADFQTLRVGNLQQGYNDRELTAQASVVYIFTVGLASVPSADGDITLNTL